MRKTAWLCLSLLAAPLCLAELTPEQKMIDFQQLAALFAKRYAFYEWKKAAISYDALNLTPWVDRIRGTKDDLSFFEVCSEYVARNQDSHTAFELPSSFRARLGFSADLYEGKLLIDNIDRTVLKEVDFPVQTGEELVSIDGKSVAVLMADFARFVGEGNPQTARRTAALLLTNRYQAYVPRAHELGDTASVVVRRQSGNNEIYTLAWKKSGTPYTVVGPAPNPVLAAKRRAAAAGTQIPRYLRRLRDLQTFQARRGRFEVGYGRLKPAFALPEGFVQRLGTDRFDDFFTGTFEAGGMKIGYLRVPVLYFFLTSELQKEIAYFEANTGGLIVDLMANPGGSGCAAEEILQYLMPNGFHSVGERVRVTWDLVLGFQDDLERARQDEADEEEIAALEQTLRALQAAYGENRGFTVPLPICGLSQDHEPAKDRRGKNLAYTKPIMVLVDELSASAAEVFASVMQDEKRGLIYGARTSGAGGSVLNFDVGFYMEAGASVAQSILTRSQRIQTPEYPTAPYIENIGVRPDQQANNMTIENLSQNGKQFVDGFTAAFVEYINSKR